MAASLVQQLTDAATDTGTALNTAQTIALNNDVPDVLRLAIQQAIDANNLITAASHNDHGKSVVHKG